MKIRFKYKTLEEKELNKQWVDDLRKDLPVIFNQVSDEDLYYAYSKWSEDTHCAGWLYHSKESLKNGFLLDIALVDDKGKEIEFEEE